MSATKKLKKLLKNLPSLEVNGKAYSREFHARLSRDSVTKKKDFTFGKGDANNVHTTINGGNCLCLHTGNGLTVIDVDIKDVDAVPLKLPASTVTTSKGSHYYFINADWLEQTSGIVEHVDIRSAEGAGLVALDYTGEDDSIVYKVTSGNIYDLEDPKFKKLKKQLREAQNNHVKVKAEMLELNYVEGEPWKQFKVNTVHNSIIAVMVKMFTERKTDAEVWSRATQYLETYLTGDDYNIEHEEAEMLKRFEWSKNNVGDNKIKGKKLEATAESVTTKRDATDDEFAVIEKQKKQVAKAKKALKAIKKKQKKFVASQHLDKLPYNIDDIDIEDAGESVMTDISKLDNLANMEIESSKLSKRVEGLTKSTIFKTVQAQHGERVKDVEGWDVDVMELEYLAKKAKAIYLSMKDSLGDSNSSPLDIYVKAQLSSVHGDVATAQMKKKLMKELSLNQKILDDYEREIKLADITVNGYFNDWSVYWDIDAGVYRQVKTNYATESLGKKSDFRQTLSSYSGIGEAKLLDDVMSTIPAVNFIYDPSKTEETSERVINTFVGVKLGEGSAMMPPVVRKILNNLFIDDMDAQDDFINWMAFILQTGKRTNVAWGFNGIEGTGKGLIVDIFSLALGRNNCSLNIGDAPLQSNFNAWCKDKQLIHFNEITSDYHSRHGVSGKVKALITDPVLTLNLKRESEIQMDNHCNVILNSNSVKPVEISTHDRRWNIIEANTPLEKFDKRIEDAEMRAIAMQFGRFLMGYDVENNRAQCIRESSVAKDAIVARTNTKLTHIISKLVKWDYEGFMEAVSYADIDATDKVTHQIPKKKVMQWYFDNKRISSSLVSRLLEVNGVKGFDEYSNETLKGRLVREAVNSKLVKKKAKTMGNVALMMWCS